MSSATVLSVTNKLKLLLPWSSVLITFYLGRLSSLGFVNINLILLAAGMPHDSILYNVEYINIRCILNQFWLLTYATKIQDLTVFSKQEIMIAKIVQTSFWNCVSWCVMTNFTFKKLPMIALLEYLNNLWMNLPLGIDSWLNTFLPVDARCGQAEHPQLHFILTYLKK